MRRTSSWLFFFLLTTSGAVAAQETPTAASDAEATMLEEIMVTAQKRRESLQETPISLSAFNSEKLEQRGVEGVADLKLNVPGMTIEPFPTHNATLRIFIRGVGINDAQITQDPAVGVYLDGVYIARSVGLALDVADLERIEVLRGPQGTLYGRNTTGGAVNLITKRPALGVFSASSKFTAGSRGAFSGKGSVNIPLGETLAVKLAALAATRDGFVENTGPGGDFGDRDEVAVRFDAHWAPALGLLADYSFEHIDMRYVNQYFQSVLRPRTNKGSAELFKPYAESQTLYSDQRLRSLASGPPMEESGTRIDGHALTLTLPLENYELKYIAAHRRLRDAEYADLGGGLGSRDYRLDSNAYDGPAAEVANGGPTPLVTPEVRHSQVSHELQLSGAWFDDRLRFIVGAFHFREHALEDRHRINHQLSTAISPTQVDELSASLPELDGLLGLFDVTALNQLDNLRLINFVDLLFGIENRATALFGQMTWTPALLDDRLHITFGYRHSNDQRDALKYRVSDNYLEANINGQGTARLLSSGEFFDNVQATRRFKDDSYSYNLAFNLTPRINLYAKSDQAYKSGGFNVRDPHVSANSPDNTYGFGFLEGFAPERVQSYEVGAKTEWLERRLRINADVFRSRYTDMQINFLIPGTVSDTKTRNAGRALMRGFELDTAFVVTSDLTLSADYAYLDADVQDVRDLEGNNVAALFPFISAPPHSAVLALDAALMQTRWGQLRAYGSYHYVGERQGQVITEERRGLTGIPGYSLINARLSLAAIALKHGGSLDLALWGKNLADKVYPAIAIDNVPQADRAVVWGEPRSVGLDLSYRFN